MSPIPYIPEERREDVVPYPSLFGAGTVGELTFVLTHEVLRYLGGSPSFSDYAEAVAALECAKLELYARSVRPHEDKAAARNGDLPYPGAGPVGDNG